MNEDEDYVGIEITPDIKSVIDAWKADVEGRGERTSEYKNNVSIMSS